MVQNNNSIDVLLTSDGETNLALELDEASTDGYKERVDDRKHVSVLNKCEHKHVHNSWWNYSSEHTIYGWRRRDGCVTKRTPKVQMSTGVDHTSGSYH
jgi:hypothetical protein